MTSFNLTKHVRRAAWHRANPRYRLTKPVYGTSLDEFVACAVALVKRHKVSVVGAAVSDRVERKDTLADMVRVDPDAYVPADMVGRCVVVRVILHENSMMVRFGQRTFGYFDKPRRGDPVDPVEAGRRLAEALGVPHVCVAPVPENPHEDYMALYIAVEVPSVRAHPEYQ